MHLPRLFLLVVLPASLVASRPLVAVDPAVLSPIEATHLGLEEAWGKTLRAGSGYGRLVDIVLHVDETRSRKYIEIYNGENLVWRTATDQLDPVSGRPIGEELTRKAAERELLFLKAKNIKGEIREKVIPQIWLYALGKDGTVQAIDAETGESIWVERAGHPLQPKFGLGVGDEYVTFISGSTLVQLEASTGSIIGTEPCETIPMGGTSIAGDYVLFVTSRGIEGHLLSNISDQPYFSITSGYAIAKPRRFPKADRLVWPTSKGFVYCMELEGNNPSELFRIQAKGNVNGRVETVGQDRMYFSSSLGYVYGFQIARSAKPLFQVSTGEPMVGDTIAFDENVYFTSSYGNLYAVKATDGSLAWNSPAPRVEEVIGSIGDALLVRDVGNRLAVLSARTGSLAAIASQTTLHRTIVNRLTDRVYLIGDTGYVQCLRPIGRELPEVKVTIEFKPEESAAEPAKPEPAAPDDGIPFGAPAADPADPFGAGNPFGGAAPAGGNDADPFGAPNAADDGMGADPFGAGNPF
ncbi:MAG: PQQ-binding-like beta-propeller repeat protein [Pirellulaceae bacterium]